MSAPKSRTEVRDTAVFTRRVEIFYGATPPAFLAVRRSTRRGRSWPLTNDPVDQEGVYEVPVTRVLLQYTYDNWTGKWHPASLVNVEAVLPPDEFGRAQSCTYALQHEHNGWLFGIVFDSVPRVTPVWQMEGSES